MNDLLVFQKRPVDFFPSVEGSGLFLEYLDKILYLKRSPEKLHGGTWGIPGGKFEKGEDAETACIREVNEEVGILVEAGSLKKVASLFMRTSQGDWIFHVFAALFSQKPKINLKLDEHVEAKWLTIDEARNIPLILGGIEVLEVYKKLRVKGIC
ncbi:MAG: NUDIX hydrolase [Chlamydiae bacterium]|nr:NUDIX hydrolase [Chlamydiota bacterium]